MVDEHSQRLLNAVLKQFDILEENVTGAWQLLVSMLVIAEVRRVVIEAITNYREQQTSTEAVYIVMPTSQNVDRIINDFSPGRQQYAAAHLFFIDGMYVIKDVCTITSRADRNEGLPEHLFEKLTSSPAEPYLKALQELYINFWGT